LRAPLIYADFEGVRKTNTAASATATFPKKKHPRLFPRLDWPRVIAQAARWSDAARI